MALLDSLHEAAPDPPRSRVHELGRLPFIELAAIYLSLLSDENRTGKTGIKGWSRDRLITAIRNLELSYE